MTKIPPPDIPIPVHLRKNKTPTTPGINASRKILFILLFNSIHSFIDSDGDDEGENTIKKPETINFVVMLKKNNKPLVNLFVLNLNYLNIKLII